MTAKKSDNEVGKEETVAIEDVDFGFFDAADEVVESNQPATDADGTLISLGSALTIKTIAEFKQTVDDNLAHNGDITLDSTDLQKIDSAGLQLLLSLKISLHKTGQTLLWGESNPVIESAASLIGLSELVSVSDEQGFGFF